MTIKTILVILLLSSPLSYAQRVEVQWTRLHPRDFELVSKWESIPFKPYMEGPTDDRPGWVAAMRIDGHIISFCDHYAYVNSTSYCWNDGTGRSFGKYAEICTYRPLNCTKYSTLDNFILPNPRYVRHGRFIPTTLWREHMAFWNDQWARQIEEQNNK